MWRLFNNALPSASNLISRGCEVETSCLRCGYKLESTTHIFLKCWWSVEFWRQLMEGVGQLNLNFSSMEDWVWYCINEFDKMTLSYIFYGAKFIWFARNGLWHKGELWDIKGAVLRVKSQVSEFLEPHHRFVISKHEAARQWSPPAEGYIKVNCDGAWDKFRKAAGYGFICMNHSGVVESVGTGAPEGVKGALEAEGVALAQAMQEADRKMWSKAVFVTDNLEVFQLLMKGLPPGKSASGWFTACRSMLEHNQDWRIEHVLREANEEADYLARKALREDWNWSSGKAVPFCLCFVLNKPWL
ncbi:hypothetical protein QQ045_001548 [Rhodiola kirilowii]